MIRSAVEIIYNERYQCSKCLIKADETIREKRKGCTGKYSFKAESEGFTYTRCPGNFYNPAYGQLVDVYRMFRQGILANAGGLLDQPAKYVDAMNLLENLISQKELERAQKASGKNGRQQSIGRNQPRREGRA